jgi:SAM-dependent methyltransferase
MFAYALTIFLSAFLLFQIQPLSGKYILPWFGGVPAVWTTCVLFFQAVLLGGYAYAHLSARVFKPRVQAAVHLALLAAALALLPITPADTWKPDGNGQPTLAILVLLTACLGLPYFVLSSTGPLMQHWFSRTHPGASPYRLYALSNVGSLLALVSYPFFFETDFTRIAQARLWSLGLGAYVLCAAFCAVKLWKSNTADAPRHADSSALPASAFRPPPSRFTKALWLLLPACASILLLATTNKMCQDMAVIPFLWVLPLGLYLLSFIVCFDNPRWYARFPFTLALIAASAAICWALFKGTDASLRAQVGIYSAGLFVCCMVCHGELYRLRPDPNYLTGFYLMIATGGALGGLFVAVGAPLLFTDYYELHWGLLLCGALFTLVCLREKTSNPNASRWLACTLTLLGFGGLDRLLVWLGPHHEILAGNRVPAMRIATWAALASFAVVWTVRGKFRTFLQWRLVACSWLAAGLVALAAALWLQSRDSDAAVVFRSRNFYGTLAVCEYRKGEPEAHYFLLRHGRITHGLQFVDPERATWPISYYGAGSGVSVAVNALPAGPRRIGVVGLGTGTMAAHGRTGDHIHFYEINPEVKQLATSRFTYLKNCRASVDVAIGDARLTMERESPQGFDLLALDAFSSDAIPVHLLTREAFALYSRHLRPGGILAVHISNYYLDLEPVVANLAREFDYKLAIVDYTDASWDEESEEEESPWWAYSSTWILLSRNEAILKSPAISRVTSPAKEDRAKIPLWTDDFASLFQILQ